MKNILEKQKNKSFDEESFIDYMARGIRFSWSEVITILLSAVALGIVGTAIGGFVGLAVGYCIGGIVAAIILKAPR